MYEKLIFHGSRNDVYDIILKGEFDHGVAHLSGAIGGNFFFFFLHGHGHFFNFLCIL